MATRPAVTPGTYTVRRLNMPNVSESMEQAQNWEFVQLGSHLKAILDRPPEYHIYVYNLAHREFTLSRPTLFPRVQLRACPDGEPYIEVARIPSPVYEQYLDGEGKNQIASYTAEQIARDWVNPANQVADQFSDVTSWDSGSDDLGKRGLFWSKHNPPLPEEVAKARLRLESFYTQLIHQADTLWQDPKTRSHIGPEHRLAADWFHVNTQWHSRMVAPEMCPNCGEPIAHGLAYHRNSAGLICVLDWKRAVAAGAKKAEEVPAGVEL